MACDTVVPRSILSQHRRRCKRVRMYEAGEAAAAVAVELRVDVSAICLGGTSSPSEKKNPKLNN